MSNVKQEIDSDINAMVFFQDFIDGHEEIAVNNMRKIRSAVINRRDFLSEIVQLYKEVKRSYKREVEMLLSGKKKIKNSPINLFKKIDKTVCVLLSTNANLYGDITKNIFNLFKDFILKEKSDVVIVGKIGKRFFEIEAPGSPFTYFEIPDTVTENTLFQPIVEHIIQYEKVVVFHSRYETLLEQKPTAFVITERQLDTAENKIQVRYLFEPSIDKVTEYFEKEIFASIFDQTMNESQLSKFASRMATLDTASENIKKALKTLYLKKNQIHHQTVNKQQLNSIARVAMWTHRR